MEKEQETIYASFIAGTPKKISKENFIDLVKSIEDSYKKAPSYIRVLQNLDLSDIDFSDGKRILLNPGTITMEHIPNEVPKNFDNWVINNVIFSRYNLKYKGKKHLYGLSFKGAKMSGVGFAQAFLDRCNFDFFSDDDQEKNEDSSNGSNNGKKQKTVLNKIDFFFSEFSYCRFRGCTMNMVDFRYAKVSDCSMNEIGVTFGDFYCCDFKGCTAFVESYFTKCSFTNAVFEHQVIRFGSIHGILQDDIEDYCKIIFDHNWLHYNPCGKRKSDLGEKKESGLLEKEIRKEAIEMYKQLSGIYAGKGLNKDSNAAYKEMKIKEFSKSLVFAKRLFGSSWIFAIGLLGLLCGIITFFLYLLFGYLELWILFCYEVVFMAIFMVSNKDFKADKTLKAYKVFLGNLLIILLGYGYKWANVIITFVVLILIGTAGYYFCNISGDCSLLGALNSSFCNIITPSNCLDPKDSKGCCGIIEGIHHLLGVLLIGYLGFIFANKMRNNL